MKISLPAFHIELGLIKCLVKDMAKTNSKGFQYMSKKFSNISTAKLIKGTFVGPQIREILDDEAFVDSLTDTERAAWESFKRVCANVLGRKKSPDFSDGIQKLQNA
jgi:hypothetical protein